MPEAGSTTKRALSLTEQVQRLKERGLVIDDEAAAEAYLYDTNYYRLSGYARQFQRDPRQGDNVFERGTSLALLRELVAADALFARVLGRALATIECTVRARLSLHLALLHGNAAFYLQPDCYVAGLTDKVDALIAGIESDMRRDKGRTLRRYAPSSDDLSGVPIWVASELLSFGTMSRMLELLDDKSPRDEVAKSFGERAGTFTTTVHSFSVLRNRCAHHGQIWHRMLSIQTPVDGRYKRRAGVRFKDHGPYPAILALRRMLPKAAGGAACLAELDDFIAKVSALYMEGIFNPAPR